VHAIIKRKKCAGIFCFLIEYITVYHSCGFISLSLFLFYFNFLLLYYLQSCYFNFYISVSVSLFSSHFIIPFTLPFGMLHSVNSVDAVLRTLSSVFHCALN
jgi:hypothetical protein